MTSMLTCIQLQFSVCHQNVLDDVIVYRHLGGNIKSDTCVLAVSDGDFQVDGTLNIVIGIVSDETPRMSINRGLRVNTGQEKYFMHLYFTIFKI